MEYQHCIAFDPTTYDTFGLTEAYAVRLSKYDHLAEKGYRWVQEDWRKLYGEIGNFIGCMSPRANGVWIIYPDCRRERNEYIHIRIGRLVHIIQMT